MDPEASLNDNTDEESQVNNAMEAGGKYDQSVGFLGHSIGPLETTELSDRLKDRSAPDWAANMLNCRGMVAWDSN
jgi:surfactin synthase thioesterase subunit